VAIPRLPFRPAPFFDNKNAAFWNLQLAGWGGALIWRSVSALANQQPWELLLVVFIEIATGFAISLILSVIYGQLIRRSALITWGMTAVALAAAVALYAGINAWLQGVYFSVSSESSFVQRVLALAFLNGTLLGAWSALYYAINFFLQVEEQTDRLERLETQATSAQLAMLRYQLNPHFLFNTLNSISTLVLLKQTEAANSMLTRLSGFLRHTLVAEPGAKVTVAQEVETLQLYLGIERMRFEERLRTEFRIEAEAANACLPSMLLQPLVENAIKYAVSPQEEGASIMLSAQLVGRRLRIAVSDTGPGLREGGAQASVPLPFAGMEGMVSTGVGLANIRDRLGQAYGDDHRFEIRNPAEGGFTVIIEIPYEPAPRPDTAAAGQPLPLPPFAAAPAPSSARSAGTIGTTPA